MSLLGDRGFFSPKDLAVSLFEQIHVPKIDWLYKEPEADRSPFLRMEREIEVLEETWRKERLPRTEWETWRANISSGSHRMTQVVSIEHASLMVQNRVNGSAVQHTLNLMSAATGMGSSIILTTTPEGCGLWSTYAEINRRSRHVFINPYDLNEPSGRRNFAFLVKSLSKGLKFEPKHLPLQLLAAIGEATQTAIDGVSRILYGARDEALARGSEVISRKDLQQSFPSPFEVMNLRKSAQRLKEIQTRYTHPTFKDCDGVET
ncbi:hypothetical protein [Arenimonas sp.]|uniref:hypothetical protein n=1 Tax=Arenimonas sp. TaxID=1872635 RepID=UPI0035AE860D